MRPIPALVYIRPFALAGMLLTGACAYDGATGYAPGNYPPAYDSGIGSGLVSQPGDMFGSQNVTSVEVFEAPLAPYGQWVNSKFGRAFRPDVPQDWRPYVNGQWGENRLWVSNDPWGWATDHYGRWGFDEQIGWVWVPGTEWAPSWVAFRDDPNQNVAGWAPIPPNVSYSLAAGFGGGWGYDSYESWYAPSWVWVPRTYLYQPGFGGHVLPWGYGVNYWGGSRWQYQPGWGGRPRETGIPGYRPPGGNWPGYPGRPGTPGDWQGRPSQGGQWPGRPPSGGQFNGRPPAGGQFTGRPPAGGQFTGRPPEGGQFTGRPPEGGQFTGRPPQGGPWPGRPLPSGQNQQRPPQNGGRVGDLGIPGYHAWQPSGGGQRPVMAPPPNIIHNEPPRPMMVPQSPPPSMPRPIERPAPQPHIQRSPNDAHNVRPE